MNPDKTPPKGDPVEAGSNVGESIWLDFTRSTYYPDVEAYVRSLWPSDVEGDSRHEEQGGRLFRLHGAGPGFSTALLQKFALALAGNLRYQTVEIFLSRPVKSQDYSSPVMVAAAFRQDATVHGRVEERVSAKDGRVRHPWRWRGASDLTDSRLAPLRCLLFAGEKVKDLIRRMESYVKEENPDLVEFVNYVATGTVVAMLARSGVSDVEGPAPYLWTLIKPHLSLKFGKGTRGFPEKATRDQLQRLTECYGNLLLENKNELDQVVAKLQKDSSPASGSTSDAAFNDACKIWLEISELAGKSPALLAKAIEQKDLPSSVVRLLFEAPVRSYPSWLRSATLRVEKEQVPVLHGDLHGEVTETRGKRNKSVNYFTLEAYERAAHEILFPSGESGRGLLHSMLLFPFQVPGADGLVVRGFVRFMNRFSGSGNSRQLYQYEYSENEHSWKPCEDEKSLGMALTHLLREKVPKLGIMPAGTHAAPALVVSAEDKATTGTATRAAHVEVTSPSHAPATTSIEEKLNLLGKLLEDKGWLTPERWRTLGLIGTSPCMIKLHEVIERCADHPNATVYIFGESGTGKEVVAQCIHKMSSRRDKPFVVVNIASLSDTLVESELFGYTKGAFTGAKEDRLGRIRKAEGGSLLLDEVTDIPPPVQPKLLRVLQNKMVTPVGSDREMRVDVRFMSASNKSLEKAVADGQFREDLYYRLNVVEINVPPLRDRKSDIVELVGWILWNQGARTTPPAKFLSALLQYHWPGNVRELESVLTRAKVMAGEQQLDVEHFRGYFCQGGPTHV